MATAAGVSRRCATLDGHPQGCPPSTRQAAGLPQPTVAPDGLRMDTLLLRAHALAETQFGMASRQQLMDLGLTSGSISHHLRCGAWSIAMEGVYDLLAPIRDQVVPWRSRLAAAQLAHPGRAVAVGPTAGRVRGLPYCRDALVHVAMPPGREQEQRPGYRFHTWAIEPLDIVRAGGFLVTSPVRTVADLLLMRGREQGVAILDAAVHTALIDPTRDPDVIGAIIGGRRHCRRARAHLREMTVGAQSPLETRIRLIACDAGLRPDALQVPIIDPRGHLLAYGDIGWRTRRGWLIAECDGAAVHSLPQALLHDRRRQNEILLQPGFDVVRFTWADSESPTYVVSVLRRALDR